MALIWRMIRALCGGDGAEQQWLCLDVLGRQLKPGLRSYSRIVTPETLMGWYRRLVTARYDSSKVEGRGPGRPSTAALLKELICRTARKNPSWRYTRIGDPLRHLGHEIGRTTIANILRDAGLTPDPELRRQRTWA